MNRKAIALFTSLIILTPQQISQAAANNADVHLSKTSIRLTVGSKTKLTLKKHKGVKVIKCMWRYSKKYITVNAGKITAKKKGSVKVRVIVMYRKRIKKNWSKNKRKTLLCTVKIKAKPKVVPIVKPTTGTTISTNSSITTAGALTPSKAPVTSTGLPASSPVYSTSPTELPKISSRPLATIKSLAILVGTKVYQEVNTGNDCVDESYVSIVSSTDSKIEYSYSNTNTPTNWEVYSSPIKLRNGYKIYARCADKVICTPILSIKETAIQTPEPSVSNKTLKLNIELDGGLYSGRLEVEENEFPVKLMEPVKNGYKFVGWSVNGSLEKSVILKNNDIKATAIWIKEVYKISYEDADLKDPQQSFSIDSSDFTLPIPERQGYIFGGWDSGDWDSGRIIATSFCVKKGSYGDLNVKAIWLPIQHFTWIDGVATDASIIPTWEPSKNGYKFDGWDLKVENGEKTYTSKWTAIKFVIEFDLQGGEWARKPSSSYFTVESNDVDLGTPIRDGYEFIGWLCEGCLLDKLTIINSCHDVSLVAAWKIR